MLKKLLSIGICICLLFSLLSGSFVTDAATVNEGIITVDTVEGITGDSVLVPISIEENPGIMATSISVTYDSSVLTYEKGFLGSILVGVMVVDHPTRNLIRVVSLGYWDIDTNGPIITLQFKIADDAEMGHYPISISYSSGDFCDQALNRIMPEIVPGGVDVAFNGSNCQHKKYGKWTEAAAPSCKENGVDKRICEDCGHTDLRDTDSIGHEYSDEWTVDTKATPEKDGTMSRYCIRCDDYVDRISFPYEAVEEGKVENTLGAKPEDKTFAEESFKEQNPDKELTPSKPASNSKGETQTDPDDETKSDADKLTEEITEKTATVMEKIKEVVPQAEKILSFFKIFFIIIILLLLI